MPRTVRTLILAVLPLSVLACQAIQPSPSHASLYGQTAVSFRGDFSKLGTIESVTVAGIPAYDLDPGSSVIAGTIEGAPSPGPAEIVVTGSKGTLTAPNGFTYDPPAAHVPLNWVAFGASITMGFQSDGVSAYSQLHSDSADIAQAAGVYLGLPLFTVGAVPQVQFSDFNSACAQIDDGPSLSAAILADPYLGRVNPTLTHPRNIAIGGSTVDDILNGAQQPVVAFIENIAEDPGIGPSAVFNQPTESQIDRVVAFDPDVGFSADILANDVDQAVIGYDDIYPNLITPVSVVQPLLKTMMARLGKLHGQFFLATLPYLTFVPNVVALQQITVQNGTETAQSFQAKEDEINDMTDQLNAALVAEMAPYPNLHVVDFHGGVTTDLTTGVVVDGQTLTVSMFGGLLSLDGLHFTNTGYAILANLFIDTMNPVLGTHIPDVDLAAVLAEDPLSPARIKAAGFNCLPPW